MSRTAGYRRGDAGGRPRESVVARRKDRILGVWANRASETIVAVPSFYSLNTSRELDAIALAGAARPASSSASANIAFAYGGGSERQRSRRRRIPRCLRSPEVARAGFTASISAASRSSPATVFRSTIWIPANVPVGRYTVSRLSVFSGSALLAEASDGSTITKTGFEQYMFSISRSQSLLYGLGCVALALFTGWLAGVIFRRD